MTLKQAITLLENKGYIVLKPKERGFGDISRLSKNSERILESYARYACEAVGVGFNEIRAKGKKRENVIIRQVITYRIDETKAFTQKEIAAIWKQDRSTQVHSVQLITDLLAIKDPFVANLLSKIPAFVFETPAPFNPNRIKTGLATDEQED